MKVLIIGSKGILGQELASVFADRHPLLWDREEIELADFAMTRKKLLAAKPHVIINAAAYNDVDGAETEKELALKVNGEAPEHLALVANRLKAVFVQYSSDYVFDGEREEGYREEDAPAPLSVYGQSKVLAEKGAVLAERHYIIRLSRLFGRAGGGKKSFVEKILDSAQSQNRLQVIRGEVSSPTYAPDLARITRYVLDERLDSGIYHGANSGSCTWYELALQTFKIRNIAVELEPISSASLKRAAKRPKYSILLNTKLPPARPWQEALREFLISNF